MGIDEGIKETNERMEKVFAISKRIVERYDRMVAEEYFDFFSNEIRRCAEQLFEKDIPSVKICNDRLIFSVEELKYGAFCRGRDRLFPHGSPKEDLAGMIEIADCYKKISDYSMSTAFALSYCMQDLKSKVFKAVKRDTI